MNTKQKQSETAAAAPEAPQENMILYSRTRPSERAATAKPAHTPGPWKVVEANGEVTVFDNGAPRLIARCGKWFRADDQANARLIAAAPTMLQALKDLTAQIQLGKLNIRKDFSLMNAHAAATKAIFQAEPQT